MIRVLVMFALIAACGTSKPLPVPPRADHAVGQVTVTFEDISRGTPANGTAPATSSRVLNTDIWYPATGTPSDAPMLAADLDPAGAPYPLVVFVHGSSGFRGQSTFLTTALARHGYVVVAADFPLTYLGTPGLSSDKHVELQLGDVSFLATQLADVAVDSTHPLFGAVDPHAGYTVTGHSTGGTIALAMAYLPTGNDARVKAAVALAPCACFFGASFFTSRQVPLLVVAGTDDKIVPPSTNGAYAYASASAPKAFALLTGGTHLHFTDYDLQDVDATPTTTEDDIAQSFAAYDTGTGCQPFPPVGTDTLLSLDDQHRVTVELTEAFLDENVRGQSSILASVASTESAVVLEHSP